jgi:arsenate reductase
MTRILILCTGNSARSPMAEGILRSLDPSLDVRSAGTRPADEVHPAAIQALAEIGIDIRGHRPQSVNQFLGWAFDYVITV